MCRLEELEPAVLDERDASAGQLELEPVGVMAGAEQDRLVAQGHSFLAVGEHEVAHVVGLGGLVGAGDQVGDGAVGAGRTADCFG